MIRMTLITVALAVGFACGGGETAPPAADAGVDAAAIAMVAKKIQDDPSTAKAVLAEAGMTQAELEDALFAIAADPALTATYLDGMK